MKKQIIRAAEIIGATIAVCCVMGIIGFSRRCRSIIPSPIPTSTALGMGMLAAGILLSTTVAVFLFRQLRFLTHTHTADSPAAELVIESVSAFKAAPTIALSAAALLGMLCFGLGTGILLDEIAVYIIYMGAIALVVLLGGIVFFAAPFVNHTIRHRFAWSAAALCVGLAVVLVLHTMPAVRDLGIDDSGITAVTGTISRCSPYKGILSGPGRTKVIIKGTSGETITLKYSGVYGELKEGDRYTFYYLPNTRLVSKAVKADSVKINS